MPRPLQEETPHLARGVWAGRIRVGSNALGNGAVAIRNDAGNPEAAEELARAVAKVVPKIDAVFFNAGFGRFQPLEAVNAE